MKAAKSSYHLDDIFAPSPSTRAHATSNRKVIRVSHNLGKALGYAALELAAKCRVSGFRCV